jgi:hypothetical protein
MKKVVLLIAAMAIVTSLLALLSIPLGSVWHMACTLLLVNP